LPTALLLIFGACLPANAQTRQYLAHRWDQERLLVQTTSGWVAVQPYAAGIVRVSFSSDSTISQPVEPTVALAPAAGGFTLSDQPAELTLASALLQVRIRKADMQVQYLRPGGSEVILSEKSSPELSPTGGKCSFVLASGEKIYGTGFRATASNLRGQQLAFYNQPHFGYQQGEKNLNIAIPFFLSSRPYGLFFDHYFPASCDIGATSAGVFEYSSLAPDELSYFFIAGQNWDEVLDGYTRLTGRAAPPPRWALGYIQSKFGYETQTEALQIVSTLRSQGFPLDALVLDLYWFGGIPRMGNLDWDRSRFPNPRTMMQTLSAQSVKTICITEPYFNAQSANYGTAANRGYFTARPDGRPYRFNIGWLGDVGMLDITDTVAVRWFMDFYKNRTDEGVGGWWCDLGEPEAHPADALYHHGPDLRIHNLYSLRWARALAERWQADGRSQRLFNLIRSGYAGMQRFSAYPWSGDVGRSFAGLRAQVPAIVNMGLSGVAFMHSDLGGFCCGDQAPELYTRWWQAATFHPIMRAHGTGSPTEPTALPEPYRSICRNFVRLRYDLLPYNYSLALQNALTGRPLLLPVHYFGAGAGASIDDQFLWGEQLLVAPVMEQGQSARDVFLPSGKWIYLWDDTAYDGGSTYRISTPIDRIPVFAKAGAFLPLAPGLSSTADYHADRLSIVYYPDLSVPASSYTLLNDDGSSPGTLPTLNFETIGLSANVASDRIRILLEHAPNRFAAPASRQLTFQIKRVGERPRTVTFDGRALAPVTDSLQFLQQSSGVYFYSAGSRQLFAKTDWANTASELLLTFSNWTSTSRSADAPRRIRAFPNPCTDQFFVAEMPPGARLRVFDSAGRLVAGPLAPEAGTGTLPEVAALAPGSYLLVVEGDAFRQMIKLVKMPGQ
jgi:alpha-glucosidase (family GH31 glycosyl hydrolase)